MVNSAIAALAGIMEHAAWSESRWNARCLEKPRKHLMTKLTLMHALAAGYDVTAEFRGGASVPIGRPINNMRCYVLDKQLQLLPVGMAGELMVSGIQLAREYLHNPEKTAASFIHNPHNYDNHPHHARMYRTGGPLPFLSSKHAGALSGVGGREGLCHLAVRMTDTDAALQVTWRGGCGMATSSSWAGWMTR